MRIPRLQHWYSFSVGKPSTNISLTVNTQKDKLGCELYLGGEMAKENFSVLFDNKDEIENEIDEKLDWMELEGNKSGGRMKQVNR